MIKRILDIIFSIIAIMIILPLIVPIIILLKFTGEKKVFYIQERVGQKGKLFGLIKFVTMAKNSSHLPERFITTKDDPRVLPVGKILRKTKINELPQFFNVLKGDMSLVGPRPAVPRDFALYPDVIQKEIITMKPGLSGIGSIVFRDEESIIAKSDKPDFDCYIEDVLPYKGQLEVWYKDSSNFWVDIKILFLTVWVILFPKNKLYESLLKKLPEMPSNLYSLKGDYNYNHEGDVN